MKKKKIISYQAAVINRYDEVINILLKEDKNSETLLLIYKIWWQIITLKIKLKKAQKTTP